MTEQGRILEELNDRSREVFRRVVEGYLETGAPVGSRTLTRSLSEQVSAATVRNVMQDLEFLGLLGSPHTSAGRVPTQLGLRLFVDGFLEVGDLDSKDDASRSTDRLSRTPPISRVCWTALDRPCPPRRRAQALSLRRSTRRRSSISISCPCRRTGACRAGLFRRPCRKPHFQSAPHGTHPQRDAGGREFLNARLAGQTVSSLRTLMAQEIETRRREIDALANSLIESGLAVWENAGQQTERLIVRGRSNLLNEAAEAEELDRIRSFSTISNASGTSRNSSN
jgi:heat-inducible transcriptional repressor